MVNWKGTISAIGLLAVVTAIRLKDKPVFTSSGQREAFVKKYAPKREAGKKSAYISPKVR